MARNRAQKKRKSHPKSLGKGKKKQTKKQNHWTDKMTLQQTDRSSDETAVDWGRVSPSSIRGPLHPSVCPFTHLSSHLSHCGVSLEQSLHVVALSSFKHSLAVRCFSVFVSSLWRRGRWILNLLRRCIKSSSQHGANFIKSGVKVRSKESMASFQIKVSDVTVCNYMETGRQAEVKTDNSGVPVLKLTNNFKALHAIGTHSPSFIISPCHHSPGNWTAFSTSIKAHCREIVIHQKVGILFGVRI